MSRHVMIEKRRCPLWQDRKYIFYDIIGKRGGMGKMYTAEELEKCSKQEQMSMQGSDEADEWEPGKPHRAGPGRQPAKV